MNVDGYLRRLRLDRPARPDLESLRRLHAAHVERVPWETLDLVLGRPPSLDPVASADRIAAGRGGFCYHLNGAFALLLTALGYEVVRHRGGVQGSADVPARIDANHLGLTVRLPGDPGAGRWLVDVGLGDGPHQPIPLVPGGYPQGPFRYELGPSAVSPGGWRLDHGPGGSIVGFDIEEDEAAPCAFDAMARHLATSPESPFVQLPIVQRRVATGLDSLRGRALTRADAAGKTRRELTGPGEYAAVLRDVFDLRLPAADVDEIWARTGPRPQ